ncbi:hypothetical protein MHIB_00190 [Mycolicibacter hiberniae]|uniref:TauD/TfdA-like domain-containing protein n=1 Tax=Mycolicibacter hiberniae TaxID=29314 RepID=A0A7I7WYK6_9MYCO|nr:hypothetical protein MHIB_00190 [Mycolicibacter hiberniae]
MPTAIHTAQVSDSMAWTGADFTSKEELCFDLSARNVAALESILVRTAARDRDDITFDDVRHPDLDDDLARLYRDLMFGKGLACVRGFPVEQHSVEDLERIYWAFCWHLGYPVSNNSFGDRLVRVQEEILPNGVQPARGTKSSAELAMHNDAADILSLLCVYPALSGGESQFASGPRRTIGSWRSDLTCCRFFTRGSRTIVAASSPMTSPMSRRTTCRCSRRSTAGSASTSRTAASCPR